MVTIEGLIEYTDIQLEQTAHDYLQSRKDVQFKIPVNVEDLLQHAEGVGDVDTVEGISKYTGTEGAVCRYGGGNELIIYFDAETADGPTPAFYAVVGEELAHVILHKAIFIQVKSFPEFLEVQNSPQWNRMERDARRLSAAIRMPYKNLVLNAESLYPDIVDEHGFSDVWEIQKLLRNALSEKFFVPPEDMHKRLMQWPCLVYQRANVSIQAKKNRLVNEDATLRVYRPTTQRKMFD
ncbi:MAG TPA: hypothetical protein VGI40_28335 [Pirellulaceae bacterium]|jgi:hypothetical protein